MLQVWYGHYVTQCPPRNKDKKEKQENATSSTEIDEITTELEDFSLIEDTSLGGGGMIHERVKMGKIQMQQAYQIDQF